MPAPAATVLALSATPRLDTAATALAASNGRHRGRIKIVTKDDSEIRYLSKLLDTGSPYQGRVLITTSVTEALEVEYQSIPASDGPQSLFIPNVSAIYVVIRGLHLILCVLESA